MAHPRSTILAGHRVISGLNDSPLQVIRGGLTFHCAARRAGKGVRAFYSVCAISLTAVCAAHAQLDPEPRQLLHIGVNQPLHDDGPQAHYLFYYWNMPNVPSTNRVLRLVIAPTYLDAELGLRGLLGENTDLGLGVFGGGFAYSYDEVRRGNYFRNESFDGHGGGANISIYHLFNPAATVPLNGILRATVDYRAFESTDDTADNFTLPDNQPFVTLRAGFRYGGEEPVLFRAWPWKSRAGTSWSTASTTAVTALTAIAAWRTPRTDFSGALN